MSNKPIAVFVLAAVVAFAAVARAATIDWVPVGNPGNANDPANADFRDPEFDFCTLGGECDRVFQ